MFAIFPRLRERSAQRAGTLSGGEQQMLAIGRGLMAEPKLLILDEPSLGLSPLLVEEMFALIERINADGRRRSCWSSRTWCRASTSQTAPIFWLKENSSCPALRRTSARTPNSSALILECDHMTDHDLTLPSCRARRSSSRPASTMR